MTKDEALRIALEALNSTCTNPISDKEQFDQEEEAITAIEEVLAQPEQKPVAWIIWSGKPRLGWKCENELDEPLYRQRNT